MSEASVETAPFLHLQYADGRTTARGFDACLLGQKLDLGRAVPDGVFAEWTWDGATLTVRTDRYGIRPLYYWADERQIAVSPSLPRLLQEGAPTELDEPALAVFFRTGYYVGEDTPFRAIRALPPGASLTWTAGKLTLESGLTLPPLQPMSRDEAIDAYIPLLREAVRKRLPASQELVMPLSGGRDSRHLLFEIVAAGYRPTACLTVHHHPPRTDDDVAFASQVAAALGLPHRIIDQVEPRLQAEFRKNLKTSFCSDEGTAFMALGDELGERAFSVFDGIGGDFLSDGRFVTDERLAHLRAGRTLDLANALLWSRPYLPTLLNDDLAPRLSRYVAARRLQREVERHLDAPNPIASYIFQNRCRREIATFATGFYGPNVEILCPYLDHEVFDFLISLPVEVFVPPSFHAEAIQRAFPEHASIPFETPRLEFDDGYRVELRRQFGEIDALMEQRPPRLLDRERVQERMADLAGRERVRAQFLPNLLYGLQLG
jgi:asparagine synthetase B (glutamine-hydrolysing)